MATFRKKLDRVVSSQTRILSESYEFTLPVINHAASFASAIELQSTLVEGALLNITRFGSQALSVPSGQYLIWTSDKDNTQLIRSEDISRYPEAFDRPADTFEIRTKDLINNYHSVEKVLAEDDDSGEDYTSKTRKADRTALHAAKQNSGMSEEELGDACGVHRSTISRLMRKPRETKGSADPGGRNPSIQVAAKLASVLQTGVESLFPDLLTRKPKTRGANRKSGKTKGLGKKKRNSK